MLDAYDFAVPGRPPRQLTGAEQAEMRKRGAFAQEAASSNLGRQLPNQPPSMGQGGMCVLNERGSHLRIGKRCPHGLLELDLDSITVVDF